MLQETKDEAKERRCCDQNQRMRQWFERRTGLTGVSLWDHMQAVDKLLDEVGNKKHLNIGKSKKSRYPK